MRLKKIAKCQTIIVHLDAYRNELPLPSPCMTINLHVVLPRPSFIISCFRNIFNIICSLKIKKPKEIWHNKMDFHTAQKLQFSGRMTRSQITIGRQYRQFIKEEQTVSRNLQVGKATVFDNGFVSSSDDNVKRSVVTLTRFVDELRSKRTCHQQKKKD